MSDAYLPDAAFIAFYSFKGGVGRSMALINVAGIMAGHGFRVLAIDFDLEAPGISYLAQEDGNGCVEELSLGIVDLLHDAVTRGERGDLFALNPSEVVARYTHPYRLPDAIRVRDDGALRIMPAGRLAESYQARLDELGLGKLYQEGRGKPLIGAFKTVLQEAKQFDFVLIDSRTGFSDESGICTRDLADYLVILMSLNRQNVEGTASFLSALRRSKVSPKGLQLILSPVPNGEDDLVAAREKEAEARLSEAWQEPIHLQLRIPYHPRLALTEEPHIFRQSRGYLYEAYTGIEQAIMAMLGKHPLAVVQQIFRSVQGGFVARAIYQLELLARVDVGGLARSLLASRIKSAPDAGWRGPEREGLRTALARCLHGQHRPNVDIAQKFAESKEENAGLFYKAAVESAGFSDADSLLKYAEFLSKVSKDYDAAQEMYEEAIRAEPDDSMHCHAYASFLVNVRKDFDAAEKRFEQAIAIGPNALILASYARFLWQHRKDYDVAERLFRRALEVEKDNSLSLSAYAIFLEEVRTDYDRAEEMFKRAIVANEDDAYAFLHYAAFLHRVRQDDRRADAMFNRAIGAAPDHVFALQGYADFLVEAYEDIDGAAELHERAARSAPDDGWVLHRYAQFLASLPDKANDAALMYQRAIAADPDDQDIRRAYEDFLAGREAIERGAVELLLKGETPQSPDPKSGSDS